MKKDPSQNITACQRCGTCCRKGGPALHREDIVLLRQGVIRHQDLVTIRKGEWVYSPLSDSVEAACQELVKIKGRDSEWTCCFFEAESAACRIYRSRPLECRLLQCWNPDELLAIIGQDTITRYDLMNPDDPLLELMHIQERTCAPALVYELMAATGQGRDQNQTILPQLTELVRHDLAIRHQALHELGMLPAYELFLFGRPLFLSLEQFGISAFEDEDGQVFLRWAEQN